MMHYARGLGNAINPFTGSAKWVVAILALTTFVFGTVVGATIPQAPSAASNLTPGATATDTHLNTKHVIGSIDRAESVALSDLRHNTGAVYGAVATIIARPVLWLAITSAKAGVVVGAAMPRLVLATRPVLEVLPAVPLVGLLWRQARLLRRLSG